MGGDVMAAFDIFEGERDEAEALFNHIRRAVPNRIAVTFSPAGEWSHVLIGGRDTQRGDYEYWSAYAAGYMAALRNATAKALAR
jgi:hypothetical protein